MIQKFINNRYQVIKQLGKGGMGEVYLVEDRLRENMKLALKMLYANTITSAHLEFFKYEFKILTELNHPNLVRVYDYSTTGSEPPEHFFTSELVEGTDLLTGTQEMSLEKLYDVFVQCLRGLGYIHSKGLIHHDIKTTNILMTSDSPPVVKIVDFGLVGEGRASLNQPGTVRGTISYLAPELIRQKPVDHRIDLYALGVTFYFILARRLPFTSNFANDVLRKHLLENPKPIREFNPQVPEALEEIVLKLMAKNRDKRYARANQAIEDLSHLTSSPIELETKETTGSYILSGKFVGRDQELQYLQESAKILLNPKEITGSLPEGLPPHIVLVRGSAGVGKSRLLKEFKIDLQINQYDYFQGDSIQGIDQAYQPFLNIFRSIVPLILERNPSKAQELLKNFGSELALLIPEFASRYQLKPESTGDEKQDKARRLDYLTYFLLEASRIQPMVLCLDSLQWADEESFDLIENLAENLSLQRLGFSLEQKWKSAKEGMTATFSPLILCLTLRGEEISEGKLTSLLQKLENRKLLKILDLEGLRSQSVGEFIHSMLVSTEKMDVWIENLCKATAGNPYFIEQILLYLAEEKKILWEEDHWHIHPINISTSLPASVQEVLTIRLKRLTEEENHILRLLSIHKGEITLPLFHRLTEISEEEIHKVFRNLERKQILQRDQKGQEFVYDFLHGITREKIYQDVPPAEREKLHLQFGLRLEMLFSEGEKIEELAYHFLHSNHPDKAIEYAMKSGDKNRQLFANQEAFEYYSKGLGVAQEHKRPEQSKFLSKMGLIYTLLGDLQKAKKCYEKVIQLKGIAPPLELVGARREIADLLKKEGKDPEALEIYHLCIEDLKGLQEPVELGRLYYSLSEIYFDQGKTSLAKETLQKSLELFQGDQCLKERALVLNGLAILAYRQSNLEDAIRYHQESLALRKALDNKEMIATTQLNLGGIYFEMGQVEEAMKLWKDTLEIRMQQGNRLGIATSYECLAHCFTQKSEFDKALAFHEKSLKITERMGAKRTSAHTYANLSFIYCYMGSWKEAYEYAQKSLQIFSEAELKGTLVQSHIALGNIYFQTGDFEKALEISKHAFEMASSSQKKVSEAQSCLLLFSIFRETGNLEEAEKFFQKAKKIYEEGARNPYPLAFLWMEEALLYVKQGHLEKAQETLDLVRSCLDKLLGKWYLVKYYYSAALVYQAQNKLDIAITCLNKGLQMAKTVEAQEYLWKIHGKLGEIYYEKKDLKLARENLVEAMEVIREIWKKLPDEFKKIYLQHPERVRVKELLSHAAGQK